MVQPGEKVCECHFVLVPISSDTCTACLKVSAGGATCSYRLFIPDTPGPQCCPVCSVTEHWALLLLGLHLVSQIPTCRSALEQNSESQISPAAALQRAVCDVGLLLRKAKSGGQSAAPDPRTVSEAEDKTPRIHLNHKWSSSNNFITLMLCLNRHYMNSFYPVLFNVEHQI